MEIKGTEKEMRKLFKDKKKGGWFGSALKSIKPKKKFDKRVWVVVGFVALILIFSMICLFEKSKFIVRAFKISSLHSEMLTLEPELCSWKTIAIVYFPIIKWLLVAVAIGWVLHGVGFKII